jgi:hypothetical protein
LKQTVQKEIADFFKKWRNKFINYFAICNYNNFYCISL